MASWTGTCRAGPAVAVSLATVVLVGVVVIAAGAPAIGGIAAVVVAGLAVLGFLSARVEVGPTAFEVRSGVYPFLRVRFPIEQIVGAEVVDVNPWRWGGWGYRGSVRLFKQAAWVLRRGEGIKLDLAAGKGFMVTVDDAAAGVAALKPLLTSTPR